MNEKIPLIIISGPTASGKTELGDKLSEKIPIEIINGDVAQMVEPLSIGTAKPDWKSSKYRQHLFDTIREPLSFNAAKFRSKTSDLIEDIKSRGAIPLVVGGSAFYLWSLIFSQKDNSSIKLGDENKSSETLFDFFQPTEALWKILNEKDPVRAQSIHQNDAYRIKRSLEILAGGVLPSSCAPHYDPVAPFVFISCNRSNDDLIQRIKMRVHQMFIAGWSEEVEALNDSWRAFVLKKRFIGYPHLLSSETISHEELEEKIVRDTWRYARKQRAFLRKIHEDIDRYADKKCKWHEKLNLTSLADHLYIDRLAERIKKVSYE